MPLKIFGTPTLLGAFGLAALAIAVGAFALLLAYPSLPAEVPLLFTAGQELAAKLLLWSVPLLALFFWVGNAFVAELLLRQRERAAAFFPAFLSLFVSVILSSALVRILRIFPLPTTAVERETYPLLLPLGATIVLSLILTAVVVGITYRLHLFDQPHGPYPQVRAIPRLGAIPLFLSFATATILFFPLTSPLKGLLLGGAIIALVQSVDDLRPLPFWAQGIGHLLAAGALVSGGTAITFVGNPLWPHLGEQYFHFDAVPYLSEAFTIIWIFALINVVDWLDGLDGLAAGVGIIASFAIAAISILLGTPATAVLGVILAGALIGFLPLNFFPAKIYLGGGAFLLGYLLAGLSIFSGAKTGTALLVLAVPIIDALLVIFSRIRSGKSPFQGDHSHLHHRLMKAGLSHPQIVLLEWGVVATLAATAVILRGFAKLAAVGLVFLAALLANRLLLRKAESKARKESAPGT